MGPFELDFHTSCTGVLLRVTSLTKILLNWPVRSSCEALKFGPQISGREDGFVPKLHKPAAVIAVGTRIPVPWPNIQKYLNTIKFSDKKHLHGVYRPPATTRFTSSDTEAIRARDDCRYGRAQRVLHYSEGIEACSQ